MPFLDIPALCLPVGWGLCVIVLSKCVLILPLLQKAQPTRRNRDATTTISDPSSLGTLHFKHQHLTVEIDLQKSTSSKQAAEVKQCHTVLGNTAPMSTALAAENISLKREHENLQNDVSAIQYLCARSVLWKQLNNRLNYVETSWKTVLKCTEVLKCHKMLTSQTFPESSRPRQLCVW